MSNLQDDTQKKKFNDFTRNSETAQKTADFFAWREKKIAALEAQLPVLRHRIRTGTPRAVAMQEYAATINDEILGTDAMVVPAEGWNVLEALCELHQCEAELVTLGANPDRPGALVEDIVISDAWNWFCAELQEQAEAEAQAREAAEKEAARQARLAERADQPRHNLPLDERTGEAIMQRWFNKKDDGDAEVQFSLGISAMLLTELAEHCETEQFWFSPRDEDNGIMLEAIRSALLCIEDAFTHRNEHECPKVYEDGRRGWSARIAAKFNAKGWRAKNLKEAMHVQMTRA